MANKKKKSKKSNTKNKESSKKSPTNSLNATGLHNEGVHCYLNSTLQIVARIPNLYDSLHSWCFSSLELTLNSEVTAIATVNVNNALSLLTLLIRDLLQSKDDYLDPKRFRNYFFTNTYMENYRMQDAMEFLACMMDLIEREETTRFKLMNNSPSEKLNEKICASKNPLCSAFQGHQLVMHRCAQCLTVNARCETFYFLCLPITKLPQIVSKASPVAGGGGVVQHPIENHKNLAKTNKSNEENLSSVCDNQIDICDDLSTVAVKLLNDSPPSSSSKPPLNIKGTTTTAAPQQPPPAPATITTTQTLSRNQLKKKAIEEKKLARKQRHATCKKKRLTQGDNKIPESAAATKEENDCRSSSPPPPPASSPSGDPVDVVLKLVPSSSSSENDDDDDFVQSIQPISEEVSIDGIMYSPDDQVKESSAPSSCSPDKDISSVDSGIPSSVEGFDGEKSTSPMPPIDLLGTTPQNGKAVFCEENNLTSTGTAGQQEAGQISRATIDDDFSWLDFYTPNSNSQQQQQEQEYNACEERIDENLILSDLEEDECRERRRHDGDDDNLLCDLFQEDCCINGNAVHKQTHSSVAREQSIEEEMENVVVDSSDLPSQKWSLDCDEFSVPLSSKVLNDFFEIDFDGLEKATENELSSTSPPPPGCLSLSRLLYQSFQPHVIDGHVQCDKCHGQKTLRKLRHFPYCSLPPVLMLQLKRFFSNNKGICEKDTSLVPFGEKLAVPLVEKDGSLSAVDYRLHSVICHLGRNLNSGHYVNYTRVDNDWIEFNDTITRRVTWDSVHKSCPYALLYVRDVCDYD